MSNFPPKSRALNILILGVQVPFTRGGAEVLIDRLRGELLAKGHAVDVVQLPFSANPKSSLIREMAIWRSLNLEQFAGRRVDLVIATKFPSYLAVHPHKVVWLIHQHRQLYELYDSRFGDFDTSLEDESIRRMVHEADTVGLNECQARYTIAGNVSRRLRDYLDIQSEPLLPPVPLAGRYFCDNKGDFILSVGRLCSIKRVDLMIRALAQVSRSLSLKVVGAPDEPATLEYLESEVKKHHLGGRVQFLGRVSDEELLKLYADSFAVYYAPHNEDYGFVTLEALASGKPVVTASDSGTVLEFIKDEINGLIVPPIDSAVAAAFNRLLEDTTLYKKTSVVENVENMTSSWDEIVRGLTSCAQVYSDDVAAPLEKFAV